MSSIHARSALAIMVLLAGCATTTPEERRAADERECTSYGFRKGGEAFAECLLKLELDRRAARRARSAELRSVPDRVVIYRPVYFHGRVAGE